LVNFEWPYLCNGYLYSAHRAVIFAIAQLSCNIVIIVKIRKLHVELFNALQGQLRLLYAYQIHAQITACASGCCN